MSKKPFSNFDFRDKYFPGNTPIGRILSQARRLEFKTMVMEEIPSAGFAKTDDLDLKEAQIGFIKSTISRLTFFKRTFRGPNGVKRCKSKDFLGYAILKNNHFFDGSGRWIVFESVMSTPRHDNNFVHAKKTYTVRSGARLFKIKGNIYCQQNGLTNVCAHAALRTVIAATSKSGDIGYREINRILKKAGKPYIVGSGGLNSDQMKTVLEVKKINFYEYLQRGLFRFNIRDFHIPNLRNALKAANTTNELVLKRLGVNADALETVSEIQFVDVFNQILDTPDFHNSVAAQIDSNKLSKEIQQVLEKTRLSGTSLSVFEINQLNRALLEQFYPQEIVLNLRKSVITIPYQKYLYGSIEVGYSAMLGFALKRGTTEIERHIIPVFGHTFNEDTWVPNAESNYFKIGKDTRYVPSEAWVSTYICHDDNFGSNFCIPRLYIPQGDTNEEIYVLGTLPSNCKCDPIEAEAVAIDYLYSIVPTIKIGNVWFDRLQDAVKRSWIVLRPVLLSGKRYIDHLSRIRGWASREKIDRNLIAILKQHFKGMFWVVEISFPELFPANRRKLGEIVLFAQNKPSLQKDFSSFALARFPGFFLFNRNATEGPVDFVEIDSGINSHTDIVKLPN